MDEVKYVNSILFVCKKLICKKCYMYSVQREGEREIKTNELDLILLYQMNNLKKLMLSEIEGHIKYNIYIYIF